MQTNIRKLNVQVSRLGIKSDIADFVEVVKDDLPDKLIFKEIEAGNVDMKEFFHFLFRPFNLTE